MDIALAVADQLSALAALVPVWAWAAWALMIVVGVFMQATTEN